MAEEGTIPVSGDMSDAELEKKASELV